MPVRSRPSSGCQENGYPCAHECISHGEPFVNGSLLAARKLAASGDDRITGVVRGLDELLFKNGAGLTD